MTRPCLPGHGPISPPQQHAPHFIFLLTHYFRYYKDEDATTKKASGVLPLNQICMIEAVAEIQTPTTTHGHFEGRAPLFQIGFVDGSKHRLLLVQTVDDFDRDECVIPLLLVIPLIVHALSDAWFPRS